MIGSYTFSLALGSLIKEKWINLLSALTIATGLILMALSILTAYNIDLVARKLPDRFTLTVFLKDDIGEDKISGIISSVKGNASVKGVKYISKDSALKELRTLVKDADYVLEGLGENPLPASLEVSLKKEFVSESSVRALSGVFGDMEGVDEVYYGEKFLSSIELIRQGAGGISLAMIAALSTGIIFVCYSTVKILFYRRKEEIETLQLLGATKGFIRAPFIIEGCLIGLTGGLIAASGVFALRHFIGTELALRIPILMSIVFPNEIIFYTPIAGLFIGMIGSLVAIGRIRF